MSQRPGPVLLVACAFVLAACQDGYGVRHASSHPTQRQLTRWINAAMHSNGSDATHLRVRDSCELLVRWAGRERPQVYPLTDLKVLVRSERSETVPTQFIVSIARTGHDKPRPVLLSTTHWRDLTLVRSGLHHLRTLCQAYKQGLQGL